MAKLAGTGVFTMQRIRMTMAGIVGLAVFAQIVALSPSSLEVSTGEGIPRELLIPNWSPILAPRIPRKVPNYSIDGFDFISTHQGIKDWKMLASKAFFYTDDKLIHARAVTAFLYDSEQKITRVTGQESKFDMDKKILEVFGDVTTTFPDGFVTHSQYFKYFPSEKRVEIPDTEPVNGGGEQEDGTMLLFKSFGLNHTIGGSLVDLRKQVEVTTFKKENPEDMTKINGDHCEIDKVKSIANFSMRDSTPLKERYVFVTQPDLYSRGRRAEVRYGGQNKTLNELSLYEDVLIKERGTSKDLRYGTGGRADFDKSKNVVILREFPQVYQNNDTITGDIVIMHRDSDVVEVENSNAFSEGKNPPGN